MRLKALILTIILAVFYPFAQLQRVDKNKVTFISLESEVLTRDFLIIHDLLQGENKYTIEKVLFKYHPDDAMENFRYLGACIRQLFAINRSHLVLLDFNNFVVSRFPHKKKTKVLEVWHATGAIKRFGNRAHHDYQIRNYDYVIANSDFFKIPYSHAFNVPEDHVIATGIPNNDKFFDQLFLATNRERLLGEYPNLRGKKVVLYAPTFRGRVSQGFRELEVDWHKIHVALGNDYVIIYKPHPMIAHSAYENDPDVFFLRNKRVGNLFAVTDILVTDYSAITLDFLTLKKPVISYCPDVADYKKSPGFFIDYEKDFPGQIAKNEDELIAAIQHAAVDFDKEETLYHKTFKYTDGKSSQRVVELINRIMNEE